MNRKSRFALISTIHFALKSTTTSTLPSHALDSFSARTNKISFDKYSWDYTARNTQNPYSAKSNTIMESRGLEVARLRSSANQEAASLNLYLLADTLPGDAMAIPLRVPRLAARYSMGIPRVVFTKSRTTPTTFTGTRLYAPTSYTKLWTANNKRRP